MKAVKSMTITVHSCPIMSLFLRKWKYRLRKRLGSNWSFHTILRSMGVLSPGSVDSITFQLSFNYYIVSDTIAIISKDDVVT